MARDLLSPLPEELDQRLNAERGFPPVAPEVEARLWAALAPLVPSRAAVRSLEPVAAATRARPFGRLVGAKWPLAVAFTLGGVAGAALHATTSKPTEVVRVVQVAAPERAATEAPPPAARSVPVAPLAPRHKVPAKLPPVASSQAVAKDPAVAAERALIEMGRTALGRGQARAAYEAMVEHEQRFPRGRLGEERDAIRIQALVEVGQLAAARLLAEGFARDYPRSLLRPAIDRALSGAR